MSFTQAERMQYIGGSDIAAVLSQSRWKTPYRLWAEKTGKIKEILSIAAILFSIMNISLTKSPRNSKLPHRQVSLEQGLT